MRWVSLLLLFCAGCQSSGFRLVASATATATYYQASYQWKCLDKPPAYGCRPCQAAVNDAAKMIPVANQVQKLGKLPPQEVAELKDLILRLEQCP